MNCLDGKAARVGRKVLAGLAKAQRIARAMTQERVRAQQVQVAYLLAIDAQAGRPMRGLAGRIRRRLGGSLSERQVRRYIRKIIGRPI